MGLAHVTLFGRAGSALTQSKKINDVGAQRGADIVYIIDPPMGPQSPGFQKVIDCEDDYETPFTPAEGGVLKRPRQALLIHSRDCPIVVIANRKNGHVGAVHAGRESLIRRGSACCENLGVIERLISALGIDDGRKAQAYITGGIGAAWFEHQDHAFVEPFARIYGQYVVTDKQRHTLDLKAVITAKLHAYGIMRVADDGLCTFSHPCLGSARAQIAGLTNKHQANWVLVVKGWK